MCLPKIMKINWRYSKKDAFLTRIVPCTDIITTVAAAAANDDVDDEMMMNDNTYVYSYNDSGNL